MSDNETVEVTTEITVQEWAEQMREITLNFSEAVAKLGEAAALAGEAVSDFQRQWHESEIGKRVVAAVAQQRLAKDTPSERTDIDTAIEVWSLPDDPIRLELEAVQDSS